MPVTFEGGSQEFLRKLFLAAAGVCDGASDVAIDGRDIGYAIAVWEHCVPSGESANGNINFGATGFCPVAEESGGTGATDGSGE